MDRSRKIRVLIKNIQNYSEFDISRHDQLFRKIWVLKMWRRFFSDSKAYTATINLPKTKFPVRLKPKERLDVQKRVNQVSPSI